MDGENILKLNPSPELTVLQTELGSWDNLNHLLICNTTRKALLIDPFDGLFWSKVITKEMLSSMSPGTVMVDVSIDQGGCFETSKPTTHDNPTFLENDIVHYCVTNMPGAVPLTATEALNKVSLSYVKNLADNGIQNTLDSNEHLRNGLNILDGRIVHPAVKEALE